MNRFRNIKKLASIFVVMFLSLGISQHAFCQSYTGDYIKADIQSARLPEGTALKVRMETPINTANSSIGDDFFVTLAQDVNIDNKLVLPTGSIIRGTIAEIKKSSLPRRSARLSLYFDHVVTPVGKQLPIIAKSAGIENSNIEDQILSGTSYLTYFDKNFRQGTNIVKNFTKAGINSGTAFWGGYPVIITVPTCSITGVFGGSAIFTGKSVIDLFLKGDEVILNSGKYFDIILLEPLDIPLS